MDQPTDRPLERVRCAFSPREYHALVRAAEQDLRSLPDEIRHVVRAALLARGLVAREPGDDEKPAAA